MFLVYDPSKFEKDLRYLMGAHKTDIKTFIATKFKKNADSIEIKKLDLTKLYVNNQSNVYSNQVEYDLDFEDFPYLKNRKWELFKLEKYKNLNKQALLWTYLDRFGNIGFKALHASEFLISRDSYGQLDSVVIKVGSYYDNIGQIHYIFYGFKDGFIHRKEATSWATLGEIDEKGKITDLIEINNWELLNAKIPDVELNLQKDYDVLPFNLVSEDNIIEPEFSDLIDIENMTAAAYGYAEMTIIISFLKKAMFMGSINAGDFKDFAEKFGINFDIAKFPANTDMKVLDMGTVQNQLDYQTFNNNFLYFRANADGVDRYAIFPDLKVESGISREIQMKNIEQIRNVNIVTWERFEFDNWQVITSLGFQAPEKVKYQEGITSSLIEKVEKDMKLLEMFEKQFNLGIITKKELIANVLGITIEQANDKILEIQKERMDDVEDFDNNSDVNIDTNDNNDDVNDNDEDNNDDNNENE